MRRTGLVVACFALALGLGSSCIDFDLAERSFCNQVMLQKRSGLCGIPRPEFTGDLPPDGGAPVPGGVAWVRAIGGQGAEQVTGLAALPSGELWMAGYFIGKGDVGTGPLPASSAPSSFLAKYSGDGQPLLAVHFVGSPDNRATDLAVAAGGEVFVSGTFESGTVDFGGNPRTATGAQDAYVAKLLPSGEVVGVRQIGGGSAGTRVNAGALAAGGGTVAVAGSFADGSLSLEGNEIPSEPGARFFVIGLGADLGYRWHALASGCAFSAVDDVAVDEEGNVYVLGRGAGEACSFGSRRPLAGLSGLNAVLIRYPAAPASSPAEPDWAVALSVVPGQALGGLALDGLGNVIVAVGRKTSLSSDDRANELMVRMFDRSGNALARSWTLTGNNSSSLDKIQVRGVAGDHLGNVWLSGEFSISSNSSAPEFRVGSSWFRSQRGLGAFALRLPVDGSAPNARSYTHPEIRAGGIAVDSAGTPTQVLSFGGPAEVGFSGTFIFPTGVEKDIALLRYYP